MERSGGTLSQWMFWALPVWDTFFFPVPTECWSCLTRGFGAARGGCGAEPREGVLPTAPAAGGFGLIRGDEHAVGNGACSMAPPFR